MIISALEMSSSCFSDRLGWKKQARKHRDALKSFSQMSTRLSCTVVASALLSLKSERRPLLASFHGCPWDLWKYCPEALLASEHSDPRGGERLQTLRG